MEHCQFKDTDSDGYNNDVIRSVRNRYQVEHDPRRRRQDCMKRESTHDPSYDLVEY